MPDEDGPDPIARTGSGNTWAAPRPRRREQLVDFLLQSRQAQMPTMIATQYLPESLALRKACLGAGLILAHRVESDDAQASRTSGARARPRAHVEDRCCSPIPVRPAR
jgi:hypothetical protein